LTALNLPPRVVVLPAWTIVPGRGR
jgi:hypothetical protein